MSLEQKERKAYRWLIVLLTVSLTILAFVTVRFSNDMKKIDARKQRYEQRVDSIRQRFDSVMSRMEKRQTRIDSLKTVVEKRDSLVLVLDKDIEKINKKYENLVNDVRRYSDGDFAVLFGDL